jgi:dinuclear metal center YbgI/SA1388 family protein
MVTLRELATYTDALLDVGRFQDYSPNGLQVDGGRDVRLLVSGVTASLALVEAAIAAGADAILVHHGYFWKGEEARITGMKRLRLKRLLETETGLLAYHLPLDAHPELGNNTQLANLLGIEIAGSFGGVAGAPDLCQYGRLKRETQAAELALHITQRLGRPPLHVGGEGGAIRRLGWCTGAAQSWLEAAAAQDLDAFISGEISEQTVHVAREYGIHYFAAGHHATERYGVQALGAHLAERFAIQHRFIDIDNPV